MLSGAELEAAIRGSLRQSDSPVRNFRLWIQSGNRVEIRLNYNWGPFSIPFTFRGTMQVSADHRIQFRPAIFDAGFYTWLLPLFRSTINDNLLPLGIQMGEDWAVLDPVRLLGLLGNQNLSGMENLNLVRTGDGYLALGLGLGTPIFNDPSYRPGNNHLRLQGQGAIVDNGLALYGFDLTGRDPTQPDLVIGERGMPPDVAFQLQRVQALAITDQEMTILFNKSLDPAGSMQNLQVYTQPGGLWIGATLRGKPVSLSGPAQLTPQGHLLLTPVTLTYGSWHLRGRLAALLAGKMVAGLQAADSGVAFDLKSMLGLSLPPITQIIPGQNRLFLRFAGDGVVPIGSR